MSNCSQARASLNLQIRTLERNYPNPAVISQCSITALTKTILIITSRMFSRCNDSEDCNSTHCKTFGCVRQLMRSVVLESSRGYCDRYTHSVCILIPISAETLVLTHRTPGVRLNPVQEPLRLTIGKKVGFISTQLVRNLKIHS